MLIQILLIFVTIFISIYYWWMQKYQYWTNLNVINVKPKFPFGSINLTQSIPDFITKIYKETKNKSSFCGIFIMSSPLMVVTDLNLLKQILIKDFNFFANHGTYYNERDDPLTAHMFHLEGEKWRELRRKVTPIFSSAKIKTMFPTILEIANAFEQVLSQEGSVKVGMKDFFVRFTVDVIGNCAFRFKVSSLKDPATKFYRMGNLEVKHPRHSPEMRSVITFTRTLSNFLGIKSTRNDVSKYFLNIVRNFVNQRRENQEEGGGGASNDFISLLMDKLTLNELAAQAFLFFEAGFEATALSLTYTLLELSVNVEIQEKARKSVEEALKKHEGKWTYDAVNEMRYLDYCIHESFRKYPPVRVIPRNVTKRYQIPKTEITLEKGTYVIVPIFEIHRDPEYFPHPEEFKPERFEPEEVTK